MSFTSIPYLSSSLNFRVNKYWIGVDFRWSVYLYLYLSFSVMWPGLQGGYPLLRHGNVEKIVYHMGGNEQLTTVGGPTISSNFFLFLVALLVLCFVSFVLFLCFHSILSYFLHVVFFLLFFSSLSLMSFLSIHFSFVLFFFVFCYFLK